MTSRSTIPNFNSYRTVEATYADLQQLATNNPDLAKWVDIGDSYDKATPGGAAGYDIFALQLGKQTESAQAKPVLFLQAAIHGQDYATTELATRFAETLVAGYGIDSEATWLLNTFEIRIVPIVNPDGRKLAEQGNSWRKNANPTGSVGGTTIPFPDYGVDLDRNYDVQWGKVANGASTDPAASTYQGSAAFSEPETQALRDYLLQSFPKLSEEATELPLANPEASGLFIDLQSGGEQILYPYNWKTETAPDYQGLRNLGLKLGYFTGKDGSAYDVRQASGQGIASGTASDWVYQTFGVASYRIAAGTKAFEDSQTFEAVILPELLPALSYAAKSTYRPYQSPQGPDVQSITLSSDQAIAGFTNSLTLSVTVNSTYVADGNRSSPTGEGRTIPTPKVVAGARYSIDAPSWSPNAQVIDMPIATGDYDSSVETMISAIDVTRLTPGRHTIFVEGLDASGNYGTPSTIFFDVLSAPSNASILRGTDGNDTWNTTESLHLIVLGRGGADQIQTAGGEDLILAGEGNDAAAAGRANDVLYGGSGNDTLKGEDGNDKLYGEAGVDDLSGGIGDDLLWGGKGNDRLTGDLGRDTFALSYNEGIDTILDFSPREDRIGLVGTLSFNQLTISQHGRSVLIQYGQVTLAEIADITASSLTAASFTKVAPLGLAT